jgi:beta-phosphoglucomutase family hydrolase
VIKLKIFDIYLRIKIIIEREKMLDKNQKAKALIFDLDGTVIDSMPIHLRAWIDVLREYGIEYPEELFYEFTGIPTHKIVPLINERLNLNLDSDEISIKKEEYYKKHISMVDTIKPVIDLVNKYHGKLPMALGTGSTKIITEITLKALNLNKYFEIYVTADDVINHKPEPDTFLKCAELMGVLPEYCEVFEDGDTGLLAASKAGMIATDVRPYLKTYRPLN